MSVNLRLFGAAVVLGGLGGCAAPPPAAVGAVELSPRVATSADMARAAESLRGRGSADVIAALGPATRIRFDSGYEVWLFRFVEPARNANGAAARRDALKSGPPPSELVMLLTPSGIVAKVRVRSSAS